MAEVEQQWILAPQVRKMREEDLDQVVELGERVAQQTGDSSLFRFCQRPLLSTVINNPEAVLLVAEREGQFRGFLAAIYVASLAEGQLRVLLATSDELEIKGVLLNRGATTLQKMGCEELVAWINPNNGLDKGLLEEWGFVTERSFFRLRASLKIPR